MKELLAQLSALLVVSQHRINELVAHGVHVCVGVLYRLGDNTVITDGYVDEAAMHPYRTSAHVGIARFGQAATTAALWSSICMNR